MWNIVFYEREGEIHAGNDIVLLHGFVKKSQKTPKREIDIAESRLEDHTRRHS